MLNSIDFDKIDIEGAAPNDETQRQYYFIAKAKLLVDKMKKEAGRDLTCFVKTFGCQMNARDSEKILAMLILMGYKPVEDEDADLVLYNTCTVRENANLKVYGHLGYLKNKKKKNPYMMIGLCGCMMQEPHVIQTLRTKYKFVDIVFGTHNIFKFAEIFYTRLESGSSVIDIWDRTDEIVEDLPSERKYPFKAGVNIMYGCNNFCSFCIVPYVRGRERSRNPRDIIKEIRQLVADGCTEVTLLGQNVNSYGKTLEDKMTFA
ncbi:MAG: radical SAM protein, partial [Lachnospiraceae bacterium]|nr:radical SAM protein [Lachnospiraceae bacterium]